MNQRADYGLSPILKEFTAQTKNVMSNKDSRFKCLFKSMENGGEMKLMKSLISYLADTTYKASDDKIVAILEGI